MKERECSVCKKLTEELRALVVEGKQFLIPMCDKCFEKKKAAWTADYKKLQAAFSTLKCDDCKKKKAANDCIQCAKGAFDDRDIYKEAVIEGKKKAETLRCDRG